MQSCRCIIVELLVVIFSFMTSRMMDVILLEAFT